MIRRLVLVSLLLGCDRAPEPSDRPRGTETPTPEAPPTGATTTTEPAPSTGPVRIELDLAARLVLRIAEHDEHLDVERLDERTVRVGARTADVAALAGVCASEPTACEDAIDAWAGRLARPVDAATEASLSAVLVPSAEVDAARASAHEAGLPEPIVGRPWVGPLFLALVSVEPDVLRQLEPADVVALGGRDLSALEAIAVTNLEALPPIEHEPASVRDAPNVRVVTTNDGLSTSRLLLVDRWRALARGVTGDLVVAAPTTQTLLFCGSTSELDVATLAYLARRTYTSQPGPVSPALFRLTADGWALESPNDRPDPERDRALEAAYAAP